MFKRFLASDMARVALCRFGAAYIRFVWATSRWKTENRDIPEAYWREGKPFILAFWHAHIMMMPKCWDMRYSGHMVSSTHRDGRVGASIVNSLGMKTIWGSSSQGVRAMLKTLKKGEYVGITPDGPRGPPMRVSEGIILIAQLSGAPIVPCATSFAWRKILPKTWDRFQVALPFTKGVFVWGKPVYVPKALEAGGLETKRRELEMLMTDLTRIAERRMGHGTTETPSQDS